MNCRHCGSRTELPFLDLGTAPPSNAYLSGATLQSSEVWFPLRIMVCSDCWLVQTDDYAGREALFTSDYAYFSSVSSSWLAHSERYVNEVVERFALDAKATVVEVAANDGYLLQYVKGKGVACYGIEPTHSTAQAAREKGIEIVEEFFGVELASKLVAEGRSADLMAANNVLAHVPDINGFVSGFATLLKSSGVATFEFPHLLKMVMQAQFDTAYHEHYSYLSLTSVKEIFSKNGLDIFDVEEISTHGGSLRVFAQRADKGEQPVQAAVADVLAQERDQGVMTEHFYQQFQQVADRVKDDLLQFLLTAKRESKTVVGYGAAAKGNTLLNYAGVKADLLPAICDAAPSKMGKYMPGSRIPIVSEETIARTRPNYVLILPWNISTEIKAQLNYIKEWDGKFVSAVPELSVQ